MRILCMFCFCLIYAALIRSTLAQVPITNFLPDVDVLYIERTPRLTFDPYDLSYSSGLPVPGQQVTYFAHVKNWGPDAVTFPYEWWFDGGLSASGVVTIPPYQEVLVPFDWFWENTDHVLEFRADPANTLDEISKLNNRVSIRTNALLIGLWVERSLYNYFHNNQYLLNDGANSFEDWGQRMVRRWNEWMAKAITPFSPNGTLDRVALDKVVVVPDGALPLAGGLPTNNPDARDRTVDMQWGYPYHPEDIQPDGFYGFRWNGAFFIDFGSIHEMNHARYHVDLYGLDVHQSAYPGYPLPIQITDDTGHLVAGTGYMPYIAWAGVYYNKWRDIMGAGPPFYDAYTAAVWNWKHHKRGRGNMNAPPDIGVFLSDLPDANHIQFIDQNGVPIVGAQVDIYQAGSYPGIYGKSYDNTPDMTFITDENGMIHLERNPFSYATVSRGVLILKLRHRSQLYFLFQEITDFNLQRWMAPPGQLFTHGYYVRQIDLRDNPTTVPRDRWRGNYFNGDNFQAFVRSRTDSAINFTWTGSPISGVDPNHFSVYWLGNIRFTEGWKKFTITADGGVQIIIDDRLVFDAWENTQLQTWTPIIYTSRDAPFVVPGQSAPQGEYHRVQVRYRHHTGTARVSISWTDEPPPAEVPLNHWRADYYATKDLQGYLTSRLETAIDYSYGNGSPDPALPGDGFSARWTGDWYFVPGTYRFTATTDDGMRILIDSVNVLDKWFSQSETTYTFERVLDAGVHRIVVEYFEEGGTATAKLDWQLLNLLYDGEVVLDGWTTSPKSLVLQMQVGNSSFNVVLDEQGRFRIPVSIAPGVYDVSLKGSHWLRKTLRNVRFPLTAPLHFELINGDIDGDNEVTLFDFGLLVSAFGSVPGEENWNPNADLDGDEEVTLFDFGILVRNFGKTGDE
ncbi:MAG: PA14 domain-containing protein [Armatimonadota bacterium]